ncbi:G patch domain-containing protein 3 [Balamuthia mandrillaris]
MKRRKEEGGEPSRKGAYCLVQNIPRELRSLDLRCFFSDFVERNKFLAFHYLHRPEVFLPSSACGSSSSSSSFSSASSSSPSCETERKEARKKSRTCCCIVQLHSQHDLLLFTQRYNGRQWTDRHYHLLPFRCLIRPIKPTAAQNKNKEKGAAQEEAVEGETGGRYLTGQQRMAERSVSRVDESHPWEDLLELRPPPLLPQGNVGTPLAFFKEKIRRCEMPSSLLRKMGLASLRKRKYRRYGEVFYAYEEDEGSDEQEREERESTQQPEHWDNNDGDDEDKRYTKKRRSTGSITTAKTRRGSRQRIVSTSVDIKSSSSLVVAEERQPEEKYIYIEAADRSVQQKQLSTRITRENRETTTNHDEDTEGEQSAEEWDRAEAFRDDEHDSHQRLFEEEVELVWEKGGSGLVFWTDDVLWEAQQGTDWDEREADEFDVDTISLYYENSVNGDRQKNQKAEDDEEGKRRRKQKRGGAYPWDTTGLATKLMKEMGWRKGRGIGKTPGSEHPVDVQANPRKSGLGYLPPRRAKPPHRSAPTSA